MGNLRTALVAWLFARSAGAGFVLRIEDLDRERSRPEHEQGQLEDLRAIGVDWDGDVLRQSRRTDLYREALERLERQGRIFPCWCTRAEIRAAASAPHGTGPEARVYPGTCRDLTETERRLRARRAGRPPSLRLCGDGERIEFEDRLRGSRSGTVDDVVLWRWDGTPAYNLAVVVDDRAQGIEEVVRGDDLIDVTPGQILLHRLLAAAEPGQPGPDPARPGPDPAWVHLPLVQGPDGGRLAKRHGAVTLADLAELGWSAADLVSWIGASLGLAEAGEPLAATDLLARFDRTRIPRTPTRFDPSCPSTPNLPIPPRTDPDLSST